MIITQKTIRERDSYLKDENLKITKVDNKLIGTAVFEGRKFREVAYIPSTGKTLDATTGLRMSYKIFKHERAYI